MLNAQCYPYQNSLFASFFFFILYPTAVLIDHFLKLIAAPNPWTPSTDALWKIFSNLAESISEITATSRQNREDKH